jgi:beta-xylosidase
MSTKINQFHPGKNWPDTDGVPINAHGGGFLRHDGVYYWFGEHKIEGEAGNVAHVGVRCYSSTDLFNWKNQGVALAVADDPKSEFAAGCIIERPKVLHNRHTGKFVMWFHHEPKALGYKGGRSGIAISDSVTGPFQYVRSFRPNAGKWPMNVPENLKRPLEGKEAALIEKLEKEAEVVAAYVDDLVFRADFAKGQAARDQTLFLDDDGAAYHIHASENNGTLHISKLNDDYLDTTGEYVRVFPGRFHEAPAIFKHHGKYFLFSSNCTGWKPNSARLSTADSIWGPWKELGNPCVGTIRQKKTTFTSQSTYVIPVVGKPGVFIFAADRWRPKNAIDGRYVWLPVQFRDGVPFLEWFDEWDLSFFDSHHG